jgi:hypothetical protein
MTTATENIAIEPNPGRCDCCSRQVEARDTDLRCPDCQYEALLGDHAAGEATLDILAPAIERALDFVHPDDLRQLVDEKENERRLLLCWPRAEVGRRLLELQSARNLMSDGA